MKTEFRNESSSTKNKLQRETKVLYFKKAIFTKLSLGTVFHTFKMSGSEGSDVDAALKLKTAALAISTAKKLFKKGYTKVTAVNRFKKGPTHGIDLSTKEALESAVTKPLYPIYVLPVENLHQLEQLTHHEELLKQGLLRRLIPDQKGYFKIHEVGDIH